MIGEFAILPKALREKSYADPDLARVCLQRLYDCIRNEAVARNVAGKWTEAVRSQAGLHPCSREILEHLIKEGRVVPDRLAYQRTPTCDQEWLEATMDSHAKSPLDLIVTRSLQSEGPRLPIVAADIAELDRASWWRNRSESIHVERTVTGYIKSLGQIAKFSRRLVIIDPFLNPKEAPYAEFSLLLVKLIEVNPTLFIEVHVKERDRESKTAQIESFQEALRNVKWNGQFELHVWKHFHDRFIISNLFGIQMPRGLEFNPSKGEPLVWTRLSPESRKLKLKEFDPLNSNRRCLKSFSVNGIQGRGIHAN